MKRNRNRVRTDKGYRTECGYSIITDFSLVKYVELEGSLADVAVGKTLACADDEILSGVGWTVNMSGTVHSFLADVPCVCVSVSSFVESPS